MPTSKKKSKDVTPRKVNPKSIHPTQTIQAVHDRLKEIKTVAAAHELAQEWGGAITQESFQSVFSKGSGTLRQTNAALFERLSKEIKRVRRIYKNSAGPGSAEAVAAVDETDGRSAEEIIKDLRDRLQKAEDALKAIPKPPTESDTILSLRKRLAFAEALLAAQVEENLELIEDIEDLRRQLRDKHPNHS